MIEQLIAQEDTEALSDVLAQAYLAAGQELAQDHDFRQSVLERIAVAPGSRRTVLENFPEEEVAPIANRSLGTIETNENTSESYHWLKKHSKRLDLSLIAEKRREWKDMKPFQLAELIDLLHGYGSDSLLLEMAADKKMFATPGPKFKNGLEYGHQAEIALFGLNQRKKIRPSPGVDAVLLQILRTLVKSKAFQVNPRTLSPFSEFLEKYTKKGFPKKAETWAEFALLARTLAGRLRKSERTIKKGDPINGYYRKKHKETIPLLDSWADSLEQELAKKTKKMGKQKPKSKTVKKRRRE